MFFVGILRRTGVHDLVLPLHDEFWLACWRQGRAMMEKDGESLRGLDEGI